MPLMTRCLHCQTVFRVTPEQLRAHGGKVRCGRCLQVFNALEALVPDVPAIVGTESPAAAAPAPGSLPAAEIPLPDTESSATVSSTSVASYSEAPTITPVTEVEDDVAGSRAAAASAVPAEMNADAALIELLPEPATAVVQDDLPPEPVAELAQEPVVVPALELKAAVAAAAPVETAENPFMSALATEAEAGPAPRRRALVAVSLLMAVALGAQAIYFYRGDIAARHPVARQWLEAVCGHFGCTVPLPQLPKSVLIEASDLQLMDPARPDRIQLTATLRNHAGHAVAYPALDLVLTNANDHTLARRIFLPAEYLGTGRDPRAGLAAHAELTVQLALDTGNLGAAGFRLAVLAAPR